MTFSILTLWIILIFYCVSLKDYFYFPKNINRSSFYSVLISQVSGFADSKLCKSFKIIPEGVLALSLNDAALICQIFYVHISWD